MGSIQINRISITLPAVSFEDANALVVEDLEGFRAGLAEQLGVKASQVRINYTEKDEK